MAPAQCRHTNVERPRVPWTQLHETVFHDNPSSPLFTENRLENIAAKALEIHRTHVERWQVRHKNVPTSKDKIRSEPNMDYNAAKGNLEQALGGVQKARIGSEAP